MIKRTLKLGIGPDNLNDWDAIERVNKHILPLMKPLLGKKDQPRDFAIDLDSRKVPQWIEVLTEILKTRELAKVGYARLEETTVESKDKPTDWFHLYPRTWLEHEDNTPEGVNCIKADRMKPGVHVAGLTSPPIVSAEFRALVERERLRGLEFIWMPDVGRTRGAMQWYLAVAESMLGRGLDHDWVDPSKLREIEAAADAWATTAPGWRTGVVRCNGPQMKPAISLGRPDLDQLLSLMPREKLYVFGERRFLRAFLPDADFAYFWVTPDRQDRGGYLRCSRELAVSRPAMGKLLAANLVTPREFRPIEVLDEPPDGVEILDKRGDRGPGKLFDGEWRQRIDARERDLRVALEKKSAPTKKSALPAILDRLKSARDADAENFPKGATAAELDKLKIALPKSWRDVLMVSDGFTLVEREALDGDDGRFEPAKKLAGAQKRALDYLKLVWEEKPTGLLCIGGTMGGDFFFLRTSGGNSDYDAPAVLVSHETGEDLANWPGVAAMLDELLPAPS